MHPARLKRQDYNNQPPPQPPAPPPSNPSSYPGEATPPAATPKEPYANTPAPPPAYGATPGPVIKGVPNLVPPSSCKCDSAAANKCQPGPAGEKGMPGLTGLDGLPGKDGINGKDGPSRSAQAQPSCNPTGKVGGGYGPTVADCPCIQCPPGPAGPPGGQGTSGPFACLDILHMACNLR